MTRASEMCPSCGAESGGGLCDACERDALAVIRARESMRQEPDRFWAGLVVGCVGAFLVFVLACVVYVAVRGIPA